MRKGRHIVARPNAKYALKRIYLGFTEVKQPSRRWSSNARRGQNTMLEIPVDI